jgi:hypothetical protein
MRRILLIIAVAAIMAAMIGTSALSANAQRPECDPWTWDWYRSASGHWYWQYHQNCWNAAQGYYTNWDGWGWY